jgi:hypothetical protein
MFRKGAKMAHRRMKRDWCSLVFPFDMRLLLFIRAARPLHCPPSSSCSWSDAEWRESQEAAEAAVIALVATERERFIVDKSPFLLFSFVGCLSNRSLLTLQRAGRNRQDTFFDQN